MAKPKMGLFLEVDELVRQEEKRLRVSNHEFLKRHEEIMKAFEDIKIKNEEE